VTGICNEPSRRNYAAAAPELPQERQRFLAYGAPAGGRWSSDADNSVFHLQSLYRTLRRRPIVSSDLPFWIDGRISREEYLYVRDVVTLVSLLERLRRCETNAWRLRGRTYRECIDVVRDRSFRRSWRILHIQDLLLQCSYLV